MKNGWTYKKLGEVCDFEGGSQPPKHEWVKTPCDGYVRMLQIRDFTKSREADIEYVKQSKKLRLCKSDDILIGRYGASVGKILTGLEGAYNVAIIKSIPNESLIIKRYIRRYFESAYFQGVLQKVCIVRTAQAGFSKDDIDNALIPLPPLSEQQRIVERLDAAFAQIDELKAKAEKRLNEARQLFQAELTESMKPKKGWEEKTLKEISTIAGDYGLSISSKPFDGVRYLRITDITDWGELNDDIVSANVDSDMKQEELKEGDILFARTGATVGKTLVYKKEFGKCLFAGYLIRYRLNSSIIPRFMYYITHSKEYYKWIFINQEAAAQPNISAKKYNLFPIKFPPLPVQQRIVAHLDALSENVRKYEEIQRKTLAECDALKQAILREVFEG